MRLKTWRSKQHHQRKRERESNPETSRLGTSAEMKPYSHHGGLSERDLREMEDERTFWGMYESTDGWLWEANMAVRAAGRRVTGLLCFIRISSLFLSVCCPFVTVRTARGWIKLIFFLTSGSPGVLISCTLTHGAEELVDLFQGQRVVQRLQWVNWGHHRAAFKSCSRAEGTRCPEAHQARLRAAGSTQESNIPKPASFYTSTPRRDALAAFSCSYNCHNLLASLYHMFPSRQGRNHAGHQDVRTHTTKCRQVHTDLDVPKPHN